MTQTTEDMELTSIQVRKGTKDDLQRVAGTIQQDIGGRVSMNDAIMFLINHYRLMQEDARREEANKP
jgi:DNA-binding transcriptional regulator YbjK